MSQKGPHNKSLGKLLEKVEKLDPLEIEVLLEKLLSIRAQQKAPALSKKETALLQKINAGLSVEDQEELAILIEKREKESLTEKEYERIIFLTTEMERLNVERMKLLSELSSLRQVSIRELMKQLDILAA